MMMKLPIGGFRKRGSAVAENVELMCDWLEGSVLFGGDEISLSDIVDVLEENEFYSDQDKGWKFVHDIRDNVKKRQRLMGDGYPVKIVDNQSVKAEDDWSAFSAYAFCLILSLIPHYRDWKKVFGQDYTEQGDLFEDLTAKSMTALFSGWTVFKTGYSRENPVQLPDVIRNCADYLGEPVGDVSLWVQGEEKEAGLDLLCYRAFPDKRVGYPTFLFQCASGMNWEQKRHTPDIQLWAKIIMFSGNPVKGFAMPFIVTDDEYRRSTNVVNGLLLDRIRLLNPGLSNKDWITLDLKNRLDTWISSRIDHVPMLI